MITRNTNVNCHQVSCERCVYRPLDDEQNLCHGIAKARGFSLTELLVVISVIAILAIISFPVISAIMRNTEGISGANVIATTLQTARLMSMQMANKELADAQFAGTAVIFYLDPDGSNRVFMQILQHDLTAANDEGVLLAPPEYGFSAIPGLDPIPLPHGVSVAGITASIPFNIYGKPMNSSDAQLMALNIKPNTTNGTAGGRLFGPGRFVVRFGPDGRLNLGNGYVFVNDSRADNINLEILEDAVFRPGIGYENYHVNEDDSRLRYGRDGDQTLYKNRRWIPTVSAIALYDLALHPESIHWDDHMIGANLINWLLHPSRAESEVVFLPINPNTGQIAR